MFCRKPVQFPVAKRRKYAYGFAVSCIPSLMLKVSAKFGLHVDNSEYKAQVIFCSSPRTSTVAATRHEQQAIKNGPSAIGRVKSLSNGLFRRKRLGRSSPHKLRDQKGWEI